jgi:hypothetical protein
MLLDDCRALGTLPFSILARCGFIAESFLRSLVRAELLDESAAQAFRRSVRTIVSDFLIAVDSYQSGEMPREAFFAEYGHLRPGTYDILSKRYDQRSDFQKIGASPGLARPAAAPTHFALDARQQKRIDETLQARGFTFSAARLFAFMKGAIAGRELAKFKFTRNLSDALELLAAWGTTIRLSREELSHIAITDIFDTLHGSTLLPQEERFRDLAKAELEKRAVGQSVRLPFLISSLADVDVIPLLKSRPNFITQKSVRAPLAFVSGSEIAPTGIHDTAVLIESADPGFDWIFASRIRGLITKYGGANSHMAIRCAELDLPAAIGCGEQLFDSLLQAGEVLLDCGAELCKPIT